MAQGTKELDLRARAQARRAEIAAFEAGALFEIRTGSRAHVFETASKVLCVCHSGVECLRSINGEPSTISTENKRWLEGKENVHGEAVPFKSGVADSSFDGARRKCRRTERPRRFIGAKHLVMRRSAKPMTSFERNYPLQRHRK